MKTTKRIISLLLAFTICLSAFNHAVAQEASKTIQKEFRVNKDAALIIDNRFGKVHCNVWEKNQISIEVLTTATAKDNREAQRLVDRVEIEIKGSASKVEAITKMPDRTISSDKTTLTVDYIIHMPRTVNLTLTNRFGDIYLDENSGSSVINLDYGNLQINRLSGKDHTLQMRFSKGTLRKAENLKLEMSYSELIASEINELVIDSKFSTFEVENAGTVRHESQYDTHRLGSLVDVSVVAKFSNFNIGSVTEAIDLDIRYGGFVVREIDPKFTAITINNSFGNIDLRFDPGTSFQLDAQSSFGNVTVPRPASVKVEETSFTSKSYKGVVGKDSDAKRKVVIITKNGDVNLRLK